MKYMGWAVAVVVLLASVLLVQMEYASMDEERSEHNARVDSLTKSAIRWQDSAALSLARFDSLQGVLDSARNSYPPPPVVIERELRRMRFAPLQTAVDSLNAE